MDDLDFTFDDEIRSLLVPPTNEERTTLEKLVLDGLHVDPLVIAVIGQERILGDGHTRLSICQQHGIPFTTRTKKFVSREAMIEWVIDNQMGRRNLTEERKAYFRGREYLNHKKPHGTLENLQSDTLSDWESTAEAVGQKHGVSGRTVHRDSEFAAAVDELPPEQKEAVLNGQSHVPKSAIADGAKPFCAACARKMRVGQDVPKSCPECKALRKSEKPEEPKEPEKQVDANGAEWPAKALPAVNELSRLNSFRLKVVALLSLVNGEKDDDGDSKQNGLAHSALRNHIDWTEIARALKQVQSNCLSGTPKYICPYCEGAGRTKGEKCKPCKGDCWVPSHLYKQAPKDGAK